MTFTYDPQKDEYHVKIKINNRHLKSPIYQNMYHRYMISALLDISEDDIVCISIITTDDDSDIRFVRDKSDDDRNVLTSKNKLIDIIKKYEEDEKEDLKEDLISAKFESTNFGDEENYRKKHKEYCDIFDNEELNNYKYKYYNCEICGNPLVLRGKKGNYYAGCSKYPDCASKAIPLNNIEKYRININEISNRVIYKMNLDDLLKRKKELNEEIKNLQIEKEHLLERTRKELDELYSKKRDITKELSRLEYVCENQRNQIIDLTQRLDEANKLNKELSDKINKTIGARLKRFLKKNKHASI